MRTTLTIRDDILAAARERAEAYGITIGDALSDLAERGLRMELDNPGAFQPDPRRHRGPASSLKRAQHLDAEAWHTL